MMTAEVESELEFEFRHWGSDGVISHLGPGEVHVWSALLDPASTEIARFSETLSQDEKERANRFRFEKNRNEFIISRGSLRVLLGSYLGVPAHEVGFAYSRYGKPYLVDSDHISPVEFNLSHSEGVVVLAFTKDRRVGVDIEYVGRNFDFEEIAGRFFSLAEQQMLRNTPREERGAGFFRCWTRKEAYIKAIGHGLSQPLSEFDVSLAPKQISALLATRPDPSEADRWLLRDLPVAAGYVGAVAVEADRPGNCNCGN
jgi:4'-phosphopantetheinyl transferase